MCLHGRMHSYCMLIHVHTWYTWDKDTLTKAIMQQTDAYVQELGHFKLAASAPRLQLEFQYGPNFVCCLLDDCSISLIQAPRSVPPTSTCLCIYWLISIDNQWAHVRTQSTLIPHNAGFSMRIVRVTANQLHSHSREVLCAVQLPTVPLWHPRQ